LLCIPCHIESVTVFSSRVIVPIRTKQSLLVDQLKELITAFVDDSNEPLSLKHSAHLSKALAYNYTYLSSIFSASEGSTIEQFIITQKIDRVKQLLTEGEMNLTEIAYLLHYSSVAHLCNQFKKVTGLTSKQYNQL
jgi:YesN/AraC family two-component response regulator